MQAHVVSLKWAPPAQWLQWAAWAHFRLGVGAHFKLSQIGPIWHAFLSFSDGKIRSFFAYDGYQSSDVFYTQSVVCSPRFIP